MRADDDPFARAPLWPVERAARALCGCVRKNSEGRRRSLEEEGHLTSRFIKDPVNCYTPELLPPGTGMRMRGNLLNGITSRDRRVTNDDAANPQPTLTNGLQRTSGGSGSVPGGPPFYARRTPRSFSLVESRSHRGGR